MMRLEKFITLYADYSLTIIGDNLLFDDWAIAGAFFNFFHNRSIHLNEAVLEIWNAARA